MAKRRVVLSESEYSDARTDDIGPQASSRKVRRTSQVKNRRSKRARTEDREDSGEDTVSAHLTSLHAVALHVVDHPEPIREAILEWYEGVHESRGMPWRKPYNPRWNLEERAQRAYEVWISEIMLQQTQVATVIPYYNKWMARFPTIRDLAASDIETVNGLWKGLGYYSRAARLLDGARKAVEQFDGRLPDDSKVMEAQIPGIGRYSAGAICSIAYNQCVPVVSKTPPFQLDGNVHRLLSRLLALYAPPKGKRTLDILWNGATALVDGCARPGDLNQALIELGATVCKVRDPRCNACPLKPWCRAYAFQARADAKGSHNAASTNDTGTPDIEEFCALCEVLPAGSRVTSYPMKAMKKKVREELDIVNVIEWRRHADGKRWFLLVRRPEGGLLAGLHEFPTAPNVPVTTSASAQSEIPHTLLSALLAVPVQHSVRTSADHTYTASSNIEGSNSLRIVKTAPAGDVIHVFSHIKKTYRVQWIVLEGGGDEPPCLAPLSVPSPVGGPGKRTVNVGGKKSTARLAPSKGQFVEVCGTAVPVQAIWTPERDVANANIGTGVLKVWKQARALWENGI